MNVMPLLRHAKTDVFLNPSGAVIKVHFARPLVVLPQSQQRPVKKTAEPLVRPSHTFLTF